VYLAICTGGMEVLLLTYFCSGVRCGCCCVAAMWCLCFLVRSVMVGGGGCVGYGVGVAGYS
jgi:hypothetical protein